MKVFPAPRAWPPKRPTEPAQAHGSRIASGTIQIAAHGHTSLMLTDTAHGGYAQTANLRGTIEFQIPSGGQIGVLGIRATPAGIITTIPALAK